MGAIPEEFAEDFNDLKLLIKLSGKRISLSYRLLTYGKNCAWPSPRKWRLKWFLTEQDAYNGFNARRGSYNSFENMRKAVLNIMEINP